MAPPTAAQKAPAAVHWSYADEAGLCGPREWAHHFGAGERQSPINIQLAGVGYSSSAVTCCHGEPQAAPDDDKSLAARLDNRLRLDGKAAARATELTAARRQRLDSLGEPTTGRGSSASFSSSSASSSHSSAPHSPAPPISRSPSLSPSPTPAGGQLDTHEQQNTRFCVSTRKIFLGYPRFLSRARLANTGHGWQLTLPDELAAHTLLCGPPLGDREYRLAQVHCHWGAHSHLGSEHTIDGRPFSAEIHFVHWNCSQFQSVAEASKHKHGLAVLGVLVQGLDGDQNRHKHLDKIIGQLHKVQRPGASAEVDVARLDLKKLFPTNRWCYASYEGSLTTPPLSEVVDWVVFLRPIQCSNAQLEAFRRIQCHEPHEPEQTGELRQNCRPVQAQNGRVVSLWSHH